MKGIFVALILLLAQPAYGYWPLSYCKCICFGNSTIIPLTEPTSLSKPCADCTRQFCLDYHLPICKGVMPGEDHDDGVSAGSEIDTVCFQRDSRKDMLIVYSFIAVTIILLTWSFVRPIYRVWRDKRLAQSNDYMEINNAAEG